MNNQDYDCTGRPWKRFYHPLYIFWLQERRLLSWNTGKPNTHGKIIFQHFPLAGLILVQNPNSTLLQKL
jgi:hypothetical protein